MRRSPSILALSGVVALVSACAGSTSPAGPQPVPKHAAHPARTADAHPSSTVRPSPHRTASAPATRRVRHLIDSAHWEHTSLGDRLQVMASLVGRNHAYQAPKVALQQALHDAGDPGLRASLTAAQHESLLNQLRCHAEFAQRKPYWDLEDWRPNVGYLETVENLCNP